LIILEYIIQKHNNFLNEIQAILKKDKIKTKSSLNLKENDIICFSLENELKKINKNEMNFKKIEKNFIIFFEKPLIKFERYKINFEIFHEIKNIKLEFPKKIKQSEIPENIKTNIINELENIDSMRKCFNQIEDCMSNLIDNSISSEILENYKLFDYLKNNLYFDDNSIHISKSFTLIHFIKLKHLISLYSLIEFHITSD
jgi:hypothetical protein